MLLAAVAGYLVRVALLFVVFVVFVACCLLPDMPSLLRELLFCVACCVLIAVCWHLFAV